MLTECLHAVCVLGVVIAGLLVATQAVSLEELTAAIWRAVLAVAAVLIGICLIRALLLPMLNQWLVTLRQMIWELAIIAVVVIALMLCVRVLVFKIQRWLAGRGTHDEGEI